MSEEHIICTQEENISEIKLSQARTEERMVALDKRINGSYETFLDHIRQGKGWRTAIIGTIAMIVVQIISFAYLWGGLAKTVYVNERILQRVLDKYEHIDTSNLEDKYGKDFLDYADKRG